MAMKYLTLLLVLAAKLFRRPLCWIAEKVLGRRYFVSRDDGSPEGDYECALYGYVDRKGVVVVTHEELGRPHDRT